MSNNNNTGINEIYWAFIAKDESKVSRLLREHSELFFHSDSHIRTWLHQASKYGMFAVCDYLLENGHGINHAYGIEQWTPLDTAITNGQLKNRPNVIISLLERGADPNISRPIIAAINPSIGPEDESLELVRILVEEGGADVNRVYDIYGNPDNTFTALEFAQSHGRSKIVEYLKSKGAIER